MKSSAMDPFSSIPDHVFFPLLFTDSLSFPGGERDQNLKERVLSSRNNTLLLTDPVGSIVYGSGPSLQLFEFADVQELRGREIGELLAGHGGGQMEKIIQDLILNGLWKGEVLGKKNGGLFCSLLLSASLIEKEKRPWLLLFSLCERANMQVQETDGEGVFSEYQRTDKNSTTYQEKAPLMDGKTEKISLLIDNIETLVWYLQDPETYGSINQAHADFLSVKKEDLEGRSITDVFPPEEAQICIQGNQKVFQEKRQRKSEEWIKNRDGEKRLFSIIKTPKLSPEGEVEYVICFGQDITEKWVVQERLRRSEERLRAIIEDQTELICRFLPGGILTFVNEAYCKYFQKSREELLGKSFIPLIPREDQGVSEKHVATLSLENPVTYYEHRVILPDGQIRWQQWADRAIFNEKGEIIEYQAVGRDITAKKEAEKALQKAHDELEIRVKKRTEELEAVNAALQKEVHERRRTEKMLAAEKERLVVTLGSIGDGVITTDIQGNIEMINSRALSITGWSREEALTRRIHEVLALEGGYDLVGDGEIAGRDMLLMKKSGEKRFIFERCSHIKDRDGHVVGYVVVFSDITEKKKFEEQKALSQKLESIGGLAAGIAHEINTPLHYIRENTLFLERSFQQLQKYEESCTCIFHDEERKKLQYIKEEIPRALAETQEGIDGMSEIISSMKDYAHPGSERQLADLNTAIKSTVNISQSEWKYVADITFDLDPALPSVPCIINELNQVILNLVVNAAQAIAEKKQKTRWGTISIATSADEDWVKLVVSDTGPGIPEDIQDRIFDPFFTTKEVGKGTGQGLSIVYEIVKKHGGYIQIESILGEGAAFFIYLPVA